MADRPSADLRSSGQGIVAATPRMASAGTPMRSPAGGPAGSARRVQDLSIEEMESALQAKFSKRMPERTSANSAPHTARVLLEENKQLIQDKQERKAMARKNSREFVERLLDQDMMGIEGEKAKALGRRHAQRELAQYYKSKIAEKEEAKANSYRAKVKSGVEIQYFPFIEGETINKHREAKSAQLREEMRGFMQKQREERPPRADTLLADTSVDTRLLYPVQPVFSPNRSMSEAPSERPAAAASQVAGDEVAPHMARYPRFLSRAREHMSRRLQDVHVRLALEERVEQTKHELEEQARRREAETQQWQEGLLMSDAIRFDSSRAKAQERRKHAEFLQLQMREREERQRQERSVKQQEPSGYWGPDEKEEQSEDLRRAHCGDLIQQMHVDQRRRLNSRDQRLRQERRLIDNCIAEMSQERERDAQKLALHREVLTTTWNSQVKIREAVKSIGSL